MEEFICPITNDPIIKGGLTSIGQLYEYDYIMRWLETKDTDPVTNVILLDKRIRLIDMTIGIEAVNKIIFNTRNKKLKLIMKLEKLAERYPDICYPRMTLNDSYDEIKAQYTICKEKNRRKRTLRHISDINMMAAYIFNEFGEQKNVYKSARDIAEIFGVDEKDCEIKN
jgi:hypothetical protein